jgi:hypothetical protein
MCTLEVFGSFPGLSLTGEMRTPLDLRLLYFFVVGDGVLVVVGLGGRLSFAVADGWES